MIQGTEPGPLFLARVDAIEGVIVNALVAAKTMTGANALTDHALPHDRLREVPRKYGRLQRSAAKP